MTRQKARTLIEANANRIIVVYFVKRTTGRMRRMACIYYPEEAEEATFRFNPVEKGLIEVWDVEKGARRFVNLDGVQKIISGGQPLSPAERRAADRPPVPGRPWEDLEQADREMDALFNTFTM